MQQLAESCITSTWNLDKPLVSICCITYKQVDYIEQTLNAILAQKTTFPFEIIVSDDCSNDGTDEVLARFKLAYPNIIKDISSSNNIGGSRNLWKVLNAAKGKYIACCEGDDYWQDDSKLQFQIDFLDANPDYALHVFDCFEEVNGQVDHTSSKLKRLGIRSGDYSQEDLKHEFCMILLTACFRNIGEFDYPNYFDKSISGDTLLNLILSKHGKARVDMSRKVAVYRIFDGGIWSKMPQDKKYYESMHTNLVHSMYLFNDSQVKWSEYKLHSILFNTLKRVGVFSFARYAILRVVKRTMNK